MESCSELGLSYTFIWIYMQEKNLFRPNRSSVFNLGSIDSIISKILTFSYTLLTVRRPSRKTTQGKDSI